MMEDNNVTLPVDTAPEAQGESVQAIGMAAQPEGPKVNPKKVRKNQRRSEQMWRQYMQKERDRRRRQDTRLEVLRAQIGTKNYKLLKTLATSVTPAVLDEQGNVTTPESKTINYEMLLKEGQNLIVMLREERMRDGRRSRKTGTSKDRALHKAKYRFLSARNLAASSEEVTKTVVSE